MAERSVVVLIVFVVVIVADYLRSTPEKSGRERVAYTTLLIVAAYLAIDYILDVDLPHLEHLLNKSVAILAKAITAYFEQGR